jgi:rsbT co-antagonist protein RsbR
MPNFQTLGREEVTAAARTMLDALVTATATGNLETFKTPEYESLKNLLTTLSSRKEQHGIVPFEFAVSILCLKDAWVPYLQAEYRNDLELLKRETILVLKLVDTLALATLEGAVKRREEVIARQSHEIMEISTPVVQIWEGIVATPLIGSLDSQRTQQFMERLLERIVETGSSVALVDITGVPTIDTQTAQHLIETITAVKLLGATVILTGVRPAIAQTLVHLGIDLSDVTTRASLAAGLRVAMETLKLQVVSANGNR